MSEWKHRIIIAYSRLSVSFPAITLGEKQRVGSENPLPFKFHRSTQLTIKKRGDAANTNSSEPTLACPI